MEALAALPLATRHHLFENDPFPVVVVDKSGTAVIFVDARKISLVDLKVSDASLPVRVHTSEDACALVVGSDECPDNCTMYFANSIYRERVLDLFPYRVQVATAAREHCLIARALQYWWRNMYDPTLVLVVTVASAGQCDRRLMPFAHLLLVTHRCKVTEVQSFGQLKVSNTHHMASVALIFAESRRGRRFLLCRACFCTLEQLNKFSRLRLGIDAKPLPDNQALKPFTIREESSIMVTDTTRLSLSTWLERSQQDGFCVF